MHIVYWCENQKERDHWEDQAVGWDEMDWIYVARMGASGGFL
jgi:hypothetical protein